MATLNLKELKKQYEFVCNEYIQKFSNKQKIDFCFWVADEIGGIACFADNYFLNFGDIIFDINTKQPKGLILDWQNDAIDCHFNDIKDAENYFDGKETSHINYKSFTTGMRFHQLKKS